MSSGYYSDHCFHCGLSLQGSDAESLTALGAERSFCCHGCKTVCKTILDAGFEKYYRNRDISGDAAALTSKQNLQTVLDQLSIYDNENVQKSFVKKAEGWREAYLILEGIRCAACVWLNEQQLRKQQGVLDVHIDEVTQRARVRWDPELITLSEILAAITHIGYQAHPYEATHYRQLQKDNKRKNLERLIFTGIVGMIPMHFALATWLMGGPDSQGELAMWEIMGRWTSLFITLSLLLYPAQEFFYGAWRDLRRRIIGMDVPIVIGLVSAYLLSAYSTITASGEVYFESIAMFVLFILLSRRLEHQAKIKASDQLERIALSKPEEAHLILPDNSVKTVSVKDVKPGDRLQILPGAAVPVDCVIEKGESSFDESLMTGESRPIQHQPGEQLIAGSINYEQSVTARAVTDEMSSTIAEITRLAEAGLQHKPRQSLVMEKMASRFVLVILLLALSSGLFWWLNGNPDWLIISISILIVTCPCALALASPIALTISSSLGLNMGLLPVNMAVMEKLKNIDVFAFDKTGTLTSGHPKLINLHWLAGFENETAQSVLSSMVEHSEHLFSRAIKKYLSADKIKLAEVKNQPGQGLETEYKGDTWRLGRFEFACPGNSLSRLKHSVSIAEMLSTDISYSFVSKNSTLIAVALFDDELRAGAQQVISHLQEQGVKTVLLSGDSKERVKQLATQLNVNDYQTDMTPEMKLEWIQRQQSYGLRVAMIGDGVNDAPTLAQADISFSLAESTRLANLHSDFIVLGTNLDVLTKALKLSSNTQRKIHQNIIWAILYNVIAVPLAMMGLVTTWMAAIGMSLSSLIVVYNSMQLNKEVIDQDQVKPRFTR